MKISFQNAGKIDNLTTNAGFETGRTDKVSKNGDLRSVCYTKNEDKGAFALLGKERSKKTTLSDIQQEAENTDISNLHNYRAVLSNTMSEEDYAKACEEGFEFYEMDPEEVVTIVDKIKAELVKAGKNIAGYTDDIDVEVLASALGSEGLAVELAKQFCVNDIPVTKENLADVSKAWEMISGLKEPTDDTYRYMIDNGLDSKIWDFYLAQSSGAGQSGKLYKEAGFYAEEVQGYYGKISTDDKEDIPEYELDRLLSMEELDTDEDNKEAAKFLLSNGLEICRENIEKYKELSEVEFPVSKEVFSKAVAVSISEGKSAIHADLRKTENIYNKAAGVYEYYLGENAAKEGLDTLSARRLLEEVRLRMSAEVNVKLIESGFAIDTAPMEELVEALRKAEAEIASKYFVDDVSAVSKYESYRLVNKVVDEIPSLPAAILGSLRSEENLNQFYERGVALKDTYIKANSSYEALMTSPRKDLGDSIKKAFSNVDDILRDMGLTVSEANRKTVRILGYNSMEINPENFAKVQSAEQKVYEVVDKMTPASTLKMIRDGMNPLQMTFDELNSYFEDAAYAQDKRADSYSKFLYGLERNGQITDAERESFIGIYRMIHQIESGDYAAIGAVVNGHNELQFSSLLSAVRSGKAKNIDVKLSEDFGSTIEVIKNGKAIDEQIGKAFAEQAKAILEDIADYNEKQKDYQNMELETLRLAADVENDVVEFLHKIDKPASAANLLAAKELLFPTNKDGKKGIFAKIKDAGEHLGHEDIESDFGNIVEAMDSKEEFAHEYSEMISNLDTLAMDMSISEKAKYVDVAAMKLIHKQLSIASSMSESEEYVLPMYIDNELTQVHLKFDHDEVMQGRISLEIDLKDAHVSGMLMAGGNQISGYLTGNSDELVMKLEKATDIFTESLEKDSEIEWDTKGLTVIRTSEVSSINQTAQPTNKEVPDGSEHIDNSELYRIAKLMLRAMEK